jgi:hypothetical protein
MKRAVVFLLLLALLGPGSAARAQQGGPYDLTWWTVDGGGGLVQGGGYTLTGTAGQPDPAPALTGGGYVLTGGFWPGAAVERHGLYLPLVLRR